MKTFSIILLSLVLGCGYDPASPDEVSSSDDAGAPRRGSGVATGVATGVNTRVNTGVATSVPTNSTTGVNTGVATNVPTNVATGTDTGVATDVSIVTVRGVSGTRTMVSTTTMVTTGVATNVPLLVEASKEDPTAKLVNFQFTNGVLLGRSTSEVLLVNSHVLETYTPHFLNDSPEFILFQVVPTLGDGTTAIPPETKQRIVSCELSVLLDGVTVVKGLNPISPEGAPFCGAGVNYDDKFTGQAMMVNLDLQGKQPQFEFIARDASGQVVVHGITPTGLRIPSRSQHVFPKTYDSMVGPVFLNAVP